MTISPELLNRLPEPARAKLRELERERDEVATLVRDIAIRFPEISMQIRGQESQLVDAGGPGRSDTIGALRAMEFNYIDSAEKQAAGHAPQLRGGKVAETSPPPESRIKGIEKKIAALKDERRQLDERQQLYGARLQAISTFQRSVASWLAELPVALAIEEHTRRKPDKPRDVTSDLIENRRRRIRELLAEIRRVDAAPYHAAAVKEKVRRQIEDLAQRGLPGFDAMIEHIDQEIDWPAHTIRLPRDPDVQVPDALGLIAWLMKDRLIEFAERRIDEVADDGQALTEAQRREQFRTLFADLLEAEREEETFVQAAGFHVVRRADADPRAVLGLASGLPGPKSKVSQLLHKQLASGL
ncbi:hypothetical protein JQ604_12110 [Bradyrhizobium jicamae]|uniref:hypothetical protein n=1 Tax=Bradyrhizobium jicamae TaxID=280332 RepID=UPI001BA97F1F|nr:hypothetical protein [Bradyrhizobium jicamae]MBR0752930.1 hypothetical protein [Bradyrhizobium jicamae]